MTALRKIATNAETARIVDHINALTRDDLDRFGAWDALSELSSRTMLDQIDGNPDSIVLDGTGKFEAQANIYVMLVYGPSSDEETMSDEYAGTVKGTINADDVVITDIDIDTSPFYD